MANDVMFDVILGELREQDVSGGTGGGGGGDYANSAGYAFSAGVASSLIPGAVATVAQVMGGTAGVVNVASFRGALTAGQVVDVSSQPDNESDPYTGTISTTAGSIGFADFGKFKSGRSYLMIADITFAASRTVTPGGTWLDGTTTAKTIAANTPTRVAMICDAANEFKFTFSGSGTTTVEYLREYAIYGLSSDAVAYIASLDDPDDLEARYLVKRSEVSPWSMIIDMGAAASVTLAAGSAYQLMAVTGTHTLTVGTCPEGYVGRETFIRIYVGGTGTVVVQSPLVLGSPLIPNAINNCTIRYRDGEAVLTVDDTIGGYVVTVASGTTAGTLYYGLTTSGSTPYISISNELAGIGVDMGGAVTSGEKLVAGNGSSTVLTGSVSCISKTIFTNLAMNGAVLTGGILGDVYIPAGGTVNIGGGGVAVEKVSGSGTIELGGARVAVPSGSAASVSGCLVTGGNQPSSSGGAFIVSGGTLVLSGATVSANRAYFGGGIAINTGSVSLLGAAIINNSANAGANFGHDVFCSRGSLHVSGGTVGGVVLADSNAVMTIEGTTTIVKIANYNASKGGSAVISSGAIISLTSSIAAINGVTVSGGTCTVNGHTVSSGTYTSIASDGTVTPAT